MEVQASRDTTGGSQSRGFGALDAFLVIVILLFWAAMAWLANPVGDFPLNDDWIYGGAVKALLSGDGFRIPGAVRGPTIGNLIAQAGWGALFTLPGGFSYTALRLSTLVLGGLGLAFLFALLREIGTNRPLAVAATLTLAVNVFFVDLSNSFMTDVPWTAVLIIALYFLARALRTGGRIALVTGVVVAFLGILIKQVGFAPLLGFAVANALKHRLRLRPTLAGLVPLGLGVLLHLGFQVWLLWSGRGFFWPSREVPWDVVSLTAWTARSVFYALPYFGLALFPLVVMTGVLPPWLRGTRAARLGAAGVGVVALAALAGLWWKGDVIPFLLNVLTPSGLGPLTLRDTYLLRVNLPPVTGLMTAFWLLVTGCSVLGVIALVTVGGTGTLRRIGHLLLGRATSDTLVWVMAIVTCLGYGLAIIFLATQTAEFFDRYTLPVTPLLLIVLVAGATRAGGTPPGRWRGWATAGILLVTGGLSVAATHDYLAWNRARWEAVRYLTTELRVPPTEIDGGYEFNGSTTYRWGAPVSSTGSWWWVERDTYTLTSGPLPGFREIRRFDVADKYLPTGPRAVLVLRRDGG